MFVNPVATMPCTFFARSHLARIAMALTVLALAALSPVHAQYGEHLPAPVAQALKAAGLPQGSVAVLVQEAGARFPRVSVNTGRPMSPASVMKLVTTYAALETLGPAYTWRTEAWAAGGIREGVLEGDLHLKGYGDPKFTFESLWLMLHRLRARGVREIRGDLVLDRSLFEPGDTDPGRFDQEPLRPYNVSPDALLLNFKAVRFQFLPDSGRQTLAILAEPHPAQLDVVNLVKLGGGPCNDWHDTVRQDVSQHDANVRIIFTGVYPAACGEKVWHFGLLDHPQYVAGVFRQLWQELGGTLDGSTRDGPVSPTAQLLATSESPTLSEVVRDINKFSNNVMARQLFLTLGAERVAISDRRPARPEDGDAAIRQWLARKDLNFPELMLENGSGLSRRERISAESLGRLLQAAFKSPIMPEFIASLPLAAVDGTMQKRLNEKSVAGHAHIKTGTLEGVKAIAGYVLDQKDKWQIVVFFVNHPNAAAAQTAQDALLQWVYARGN